MPLSFISDLPAQRPARGDRTGTVGEFVAVVSDAAGAFEDGIDTVGTAGVVVVTVVETVGVPSDAGVTLVVVSVRQPTDARQSATHAISPYINLPFISFLPFVCIRRIVRCCLDVSPYS